MEASERKEDKILVCIHCTTYNHEKYIRQCLDGFVMQKTDFRYVALVHDDASTDNTPAIIREYAEKYPDIIKPIFEEENLYSKGNGMLRKVMNSACAKTGAKYLAICEGDDYWTCPDKLQKQVDFMEGHPDYVICYHDVRLQYQEKGVIKDLLDVKDVPQTTTILDLAEGNYIHTLSVLYRYNPQVEVERNQIGNVVAEDYVTHMLYSKHGKIFRIYEKMGVYRIHQGGVWSMKGCEFVYPEFIYGLCELSTLLPAEVRKVFKRQAAYIVKCIMDACQSEIKQSPQYRLGKTIYPLRISKKINDIRSHLHI